MAKINIYNFEDLLKKIRVIDLDKCEELFLISETQRKLESKELYNALNIYSWFNERKSYYVLFDYVIYKGKKKFFRGSTVIIDSETLSDFVKKIIDEDIERPLRILPFDEPNDFLIVLDDTSSMYLYSEA